MDSRAIYVVIRREEDQYTPERWRILLTREQVERVRAALGLPEGTDNHDRRILRVAPGTADFATEEEARARLARLAALGVRAEAQLLRATLRPKPKPWVAQLGVGGFTAHVGTYATEDEAEAGGRAAWAAHVAEIPTAPPEPHILRPGPRETGWDVLERERRQRAGS